MTPQKQACAIAREFLYNNAPLVETCRFIQRPLDELGLRLENEFIAFVGIDSDTDQYPLGAERKHWNSDALSRKDHEYAAFEQSYRQIVEEACRAVLVRFEDEDAIQ